MTFSSQQPDGDVYFYNYSTGQSIWEHPSDNKYRQMVVEERKKIQLSTRIQEQAISVTNYFPLTFFNLLTFFQKSSSSLTRQPLAPLRPAPLGVSILVYI